LHVNQLTAANASSDTNGHPSPKSQTLFADSSSQYYQNNPPTSPGLPVFARRKRSLFKGPLSGNGGFASGTGGFGGFGISTGSGGHVGGSAWTGSGGGGGSPGGFPRTNGSLSNGSNNNKSDRNPSVQGRASSDLGMLGVMEEEEDEEEEEEEVAGQFPQPQPQSATTPGAASSFEGGILEEEDDDALYEDVEIDRFGRSVIIHADGHEEVITEEIMEEGEEEEVVPVYVTAPPSLSGRDPSASSTVAVAAAAIDTAPSAPAVPSTTADDKPNGTAPATSPAKLTTTLSTIIAAAATATTTNGAGAAAGSRPGTSSGKAASAATVTATTTATTIITKVEDGMAEKAEQVPATAAADPVSADVKNTGANAAGTSGEGA
jgi:hypothetical protein